MQLLRTNFFVILLIILISLPFLYILGSNYGPVNDAWVWVSLIDQGSVSVSKTISKIMNGDINSRLFRILPWLIYSEVNDPNFWTIKASMYLIFIFSFLGVFSLIKIFLQKQPLTCFLLSILFSLFPYDGTIMWMGASGVNLSFLFAVWSLRNISIGMKNKNSYLFALGLALGFISFLTYPGHIFLYLAILGICLLCFSKNIKHFIFATLSSILAISLAAIPIILELKNGESRNSAVVNIEGELIFDGFVNAFNTIFIKAPIDIILPDIEFMLAGFTTSIFVTVIIFFSKYRKPVTEETYQPNEFHLFKNIKFLNKLSRSPFILLAIAVVFFIVGYLPYSISNIRFGVGRELLYARSSILVLIIAIISILSQKTAIKKLSSSKVVPIFFACILGLIIQEKLKVASDYRKGSDQVQYFLGEMTRVVPSIQEDQRVIVFFEDPQSYEKGFQMVFNRPQFPLSYLYDTPYNKVAIKPMIASHLMQKNRGVKNIRSLDKLIKVDHEMDITLVYNSHTGLRELTNYSTTVRNQNITLTGLPGLENVSTDPVNLTNRQARYRNFGNK